MTVLVQITRSTSGLRTLDQEGVEGEDILRPSGDGEGGESLWVHVTPLSVWSDVHSRNLSLSGPFLKVETLGVKKVDIYFYY